ncbi:carbohydrate ABC transporter permease [Nocardiopsis algeriensis]|uniref:Alpha-glucoside transport system permease protein n=1 Tax=Nocardiopsis algeriensis TaxID=1478215 RepID=A0A841IWZ5_9ACTN|nr:sugar ABC transporter permease [Nocardiopsis algeriensis]MBB6120728.1 alpha-glucoside transport system permease protein [Nocardiopsis algeriensis]
MEFSFLNELPKIVWMLIGIAVFLAVIGLLLVLVDLPRTRRDRWQAFLFLAPALLLLLGGIVYPGVRTTLLSFYDRSGETFVGLDNYLWMFERPEILQVLFNTLLWVLFAPLLSTAIGLVYSVLVDRSRFEPIAKSLVFMPMAISFVGASIIWRFVFAYRPADQEQYGLFNQIVVWLGGEPRLWLLEQPINTFLLILVLIWVQAGFAMVVLSAAIKAIPADMVEAARIDGAGPFNLFFRITLPTVWPTLLVVFITITVQTLKVFDIVRTMTGGNYGTSVIANEMYSQAFQQGQTGQGSALAVFLFVLVIPLVVVQIRRMRKARELA